MANDSRFGRLARLGGLTTKVTSGWIGQRVRSAFADEEGRRKLEERFHLESAAQMVETLGRLKGAAMKVGQSISLAAQHLDLPEDARALLNKLQSQGEPVPFERIRATVERELEGTLEAKFKSFDPHPLGTASLAQAHVAFLHDGSEVVVKVLHDGVDDALDTDLMALRGLLATGRALGRDKDELEGVFAEVRERLSEELDYLHEARNLHEFHRAFGADPDLRIPRHHPAYCTERVIVLDRLPGKPMTVFLQTATPEARQRAGLALARLFLDGAFRHRLLHADPHPGNFLFEEDGRVGLLDFGCVKRFDRFWIGHYARAVKAALIGDRAMLFQAVRDLGAWRGESEKGGDIIWDFCHSIIDPLQHGPHTLGTDDTAVEKVQAVVKRMWAVPEVVGPPDIVFLHRTLGGLYTMASQLKVTEDWPKMVMPYVDHAISEMR